MIDVDEDDERLRLRGCLQGRRNDELSPWVFGVFGVLTPQRRWFSRKLHATSQKGWKVSKTHIVLECAHFFHQHTKFFLQKSHELNIAKKVFQCLWYILDSLRVEVINIWKKIINIKGIHLSNRSQNIHYFVNFQIWAPALISFLNHQQRQQTAPGCDFLSQLWLNDGLQNARTARVDFSPRVCLWSHLRNFCNLGKRGTVLPLFARTTPPSFTSW